MTPMTPWDRTWLFFRAVGEAACLVAAVVVVCAGLLASFGGVP